MRILVTGNGSGIGRAITKELAEAKHIVEGTHWFSTRGKPHRAWNVCIEEEIAEFFAGVPALDVLVNNAGILDHEEFGNLTMDGILAILETNIAAPLLLAQAAVKCGAKIIVNIGSMYGITGAYGKKPTYAASKAALHNCTLSLSRLLGPQGVRVVGIAPGIIPTGIHDGQGGIDKHGTGHSSIGRVGTVEEIARTVRFLIEEGTYINGTIIEVSGGR